MAEKVIGFGLTFADVLIIPRHSKVLPNEVSLKTRLAVEIYLNIPLISAAMDTVTEHVMAIAMAREGGLGIIHKNCPIDYQAEQVSLVKRAQSGLITKPYCLSPTNTLREVKNLMALHHISGVPIVDNGKLVGLITRRDIRFLADNDQSLIKEIMRLRKKLIVSGPKTTLEQAKKILQKNRIEKLPLVDDNDHLVGLITIKDIQQQIEYPQAVKDQKGRLLVGAAVGVGTDLEERTAALVKAGVNILCLDSAHGHAQGVLEAIKWVKKHYPKVILIGGNISTYQGALDLIKAGVNAIKVGQGPGSICTTRAVTGCGMPQITAIMEAMRAAKESNIPVIADGGIEYSGDITKALAAGASTVMIGSLFAGTKESPGEIITIEGKSHKDYRGMGSLAAMVKGSADRYFQNGKSLSKLVPEGVEAAVPYRGELTDVIFQLLGGVRAGMGLAGAVDIQSLWDTQFIQVTNAGAQEGHPHGVYIVKEPPNYPITVRR